MKVVHLMGALRPSGMERMFLSASPHFQRAGVETLIVGQGSEHPFAEDLVRAGYGVETIPSIKTYGGATALAGILKRTRPDVVHIHTEGAFAVAALVTRTSLPKTPIVRTIHSIFRPTGRAKFSRRLQGWGADRAVSAFVAISPEVQENERLYNRRAQLIFNWVGDKYFELGKKPAHRNSRPSAVIVGNSSDIKNQALALRAIQKIDMDLYFHGDESGATPEEVGILNALEREGRLLHRGTSGPSTSLLHGSIFLLPSLHEGFGIALAEALVAGLPAIVNDAPGLRWARSFPNVTLLPITQEAWDTGLAHAVQSPQPDAGQGNEHPIDLTASRGTSEYLHLYAALRGGQHRSGARPSEQDLS